MSAREAFFAEVHTDPYAHAITDIWARAWVEGYEQALRDHGLTDARLAMSYSDRRREALSYLTAAKNEAETRFLIAMAQIGSRLAVSGSAGSDTP